MWSELVKYASSSFLVMLLYVVALGTVIIIIKEKKYNYQKDRKIINIAIIFFVALILSISCFFVPDSDKANAQIAIVAFGGVFFLWILAKKKKKKKRLSYSEELEEMVNTKLTETERKVFEVAVKNPDYSNSEIGKQKMLNHIAGSTVSAHLSRIYEKLGIESEDKNELRKLLVEKFKDIVY